jgi:TolA-binding protein
MHREVNVLGNLALAVGLSALMVSCLSWFPNKKAGQQEGSVEQASVADNTAEAEDKVLTDKKAPLAGDRPVGASALDGLELKQARLWTRVDELEAMVRAQKARIKLLEKGLMLGVIPEGLEEPLAKKAVVETLQEIENPISEKVVPKKAETADAEKPGHPAENSEFQEKMLVAKEMFKAGRFGKAYLEFSKIDKEFVDDISTGEPKYWLGRCWYQLKEYQTAIQNLKAFGTSYPASPWAASAKFFLARSELDSGLREAAVKHFQEIIRDHPYDGTAEAAKQAIGNLEKAL